MGGSGSKGQPAAPTGGGGSPSPPPKTDSTPMVQKKFDSWHAEQKSDPGFGCDEEENQDAVLVTELKGSFELFSIFDGHGHLGKLVAEAAKDGVIEVLAEHLSADKSSDGVCKVFKALDASVCSSEDAAEAGCSATLVLYDPAAKMLLVGNVGDTRVVVGSGAAGVTPKVLTEDHLPGVPAEKQRIIAAGGVVRATDDVQLGELGGQRVWKGGSDKPGLPLSRSLGDKMAKELGVTAEPSVHQHTLKAEDRFMVLASGGVWKVFSPQELVDVVAQQPDAAAAAEAVIAEASKRWEELWQGENTSVVVVVFPSS